MSKDSDTVKLSGEMPPQSRPASPVGLIADRDDPLLGCLLALAKIYERPLSAHALSAGLPLENERLTPELFLRAAQRANLSARIVRRRIESIPELVLPVVLLLENGDASLLTRRIDRHTVEILIPHSGDGAKPIELSALQSAYSGYAIFVHPEYRFDNRLPDGDPARPRSWFWGTLLLFWRPYLQVAAAAVLINIFALTTPLFIRSVYDRVIPNNALDSLWVLAIGAGAVMVFDLLLRVLRGYFVDTVGKSADVLLSSRIFEQVLCMQMRARPNSAGAFANDLREFESVRDFFTAASLTALVDLPFVLLFVFVIFLLGGPVAILVGGVVVAVLLVGVCIQIPLTNTLRRAHRETAQKHGLLIEALNGLETIKCLGAEGRVQRQWESLVSAAARSSLAARLISALGINLSLFLQQMTTIAVIVYSVYLVKDGQITVGAVIAITLLGNRAIAPLSQIAGVLARVNQSFVALRALNSIMKLPVERPPDRNFVRRSITKGAVEFQEVSFTYPHSQRPALSHASFRISAGERAGLIGRLGSGKSTLTKLVMGLHHPSAGSVLVDGTDLRQIDPADLRRAIGCVMQDVVLFHGSVRDNIAFGAPHVDDAMILRAAKIAGVDDFISQHPLGYDLQVGEGGLGLSGGQRQAIALARAVLLNPPILIFDEPTSAMDNRSELNFMQQLSTILPGKTVLLATHRASLLSLVDRIIVMDQGRVVADGPRNEILERLNQGKIKVAA